MIRCCVVDDEPLARDLIASYVERTPYLHLVGKFSSAQDAVRVVISGDIDLIFLDIQMPQLTGMEFAKLVPKSCRIIFTTAYANFAIDGFKVNAIDYLLKPISYDEFLAAATKAMHMIKAENDTIQTLSRRFIIIKSDYRMLQIDTDKVLFIEAVKDYVKIYMDHESTPIMTLMNIKNLETTLPSHFMRVHRSFIVNTHQIRIIERNRIIFGNHYIPVSDSYKQQFNDYISRHLPVPM